MAAIWACGKAVESGDILNPVHLEPDLDAEDSRIFQIATPKTEDDEDTRVSDLATQSTNHRIGAERP